MAVHEPGSLKVAGERAEDEVAPVGLQQTECTRECLAVRVNLKPDSSDSDQLAGSFGRFSPQKRIHLGPDQTGDLISLLVHINEASFCERRLLERLDYNGQIQPFIA